MDTDPTLWQHSHAHLIVTCYTVAFRLLRSGVFTPAAASDEVRRHHASGYADEEVADALRFLERKSLLRLVSPCDPDYPIYAPGSAFPSSWTDAG